MAIFFSSDQHFWHNKVISLCNRPFSNIEEMNSHLINNWNRVVQPEDTIYILGDMFFCNTKKAEEILAQLNGKKILIVGNHDKFSLTKLKKMFHEVHYRLELEIAGEKVQLSHYPYAPTKKEKFIHILKNFYKFWRKKKYMELRYMDRRPINNGGWLLHGHCHTAWQIKGKQFNVGVDVNEFYPVALESVEDLIRGKF